MSFMLYLVGFVVFVSGLAWIATMAGVSQSYILVGAGVLMAVGLFTALSQRSRLRGPAA